MYTIWNGFNKFRRYSNDIIYSIGIVAKQNKNLVNSKMVSVSFMIVQTFLAFDKMKIAFGFLVFVHFLSSLLSSQIENSWCEHSMELKFQCLIILKIIYKTRLSRHLSLARKHIHNYILTRIGNFPTQIEVHSARVFPLPKLIE